MDWDALIVGGIGVAGVVLGQLLQRRWSRDDAQRQRRWSLEDAQREEAQRARERTADVVGPLKALVAEADSDKLGIIAGDRSARVLDDLWERWRSLRLELSVVALTHPSHAVRDVMEAVTVAVPNSLYSTMWFVDDLLDRRADSMPARWGAKVDYTFANGLVELLADAITGRVGGNDVETRLEEITREHKAADDPETA